MPTTQLSAKLTAASARSRTDCSTALAMTGLNTFSSKWPWLPAKATVVPLPITCVQTIVSASHWVGLTLPGMIEEPGSFSGSDSSPRPERGPDARRRISCAILNRPEARAASAPCVKTRASWVASASNLFSAEVNGNPVSSAVLAAKASANLGCAFSPVPTAVPPCASASTPGKVAAIRAPPSATCCA
ncbi:hypothetical protein AEGHOMDF_2493 [Methylobacterium soli]|nr:hypothetical protein AEGHOMDF_2493 [Methylobacterium soli]